MSANSTPYEVCAREWCGRECRNAIIWHAPRYLQSVGTAHSLTAQWYRAANSRKLVQIPYNEPHQRRQPAFENVRALLDDLMARLLIRVIELMRVFVSVNVYDRPDKLVTCPLYHRVANFKCNVSYSWFIATLFALEQLNL